MRRITLLIVLAGIFIYIGINARTGGWLHAVDIRSNSLILAHRTSLGNGIMLLMTTLLGPYFLSAIAVLFAALLLHHERYRALATLVASLAIAPISWWIIKTITAIPRPAVGGLVTTTGLSFPSGHAGYAAVFFGWLILNDIFKKRSILMHYLVTACCIVAIALAGISRMYLGVHWFSDVLGGITLGIFWVLFFDYAFKRAPLRAPTHK